MFSMFYHATNFNGDVSTWDTSKVTNMESMFSWTGLFNRDISKWDTSQVTNMRFMFDNATSFNSDISKWDTSNVIDMSYMFRKASSFNRDVASWNIFNVRHMDKIFDGTGLLKYKLSLEAKSENEQLYIVFSSIWNTEKTSKGSSESNQIKLPLEKDGTYFFSIDWGDGSMSRITNSKPSEILHTYANSAIYEIKIWGTIIGFRFTDEEDRNKIIEIKSWGPLRFINNGFYFSEAENLTISAYDPPDLTGITNLSGMFYKCTSLIGDFSSWNTSNVTTMSSMFEQATAFNQDLSTWDKSKVTDMSSMFEEATAFNGDISTWNTHKVESMMYMFAYATSFNRDISIWDISN